MYTVIFSWLMHDLGECLVVGGDWIACSLACQYVGVEPLSLLTKSVIDNMSLQYAPFRICSHKYKRGMSLLSFPSIGLFFITGLP